MSVQAHSLTHRPFPREVTRDCLLQCWQSRDREDSHWQDDEGGTQRADGGQGDWEEGEGGDGSKWTWRDIGSLDLVERGRGWSLLWHEGLAVNPVPSSGLKTELTIKPPPWADQLSQWLCQIRLCSHDKLSAKLSDVIFRGNFSIVCHLECESFYLSVSSWDFLPSSLPKLIYTGGREAIKLWVVTH